MLSTAPRLDTDARNPAIARAPAAFAEAASAAARLHAELMAHAENTVSTVRTGAATRLDLVQASLDDALSQLEERLAGARFTLGSCADEALAKIAERAADARTEIRRAAAGATARLRAAAKDLHTAFAVPEAKEKAVESDARASIAAIVDDGELAAGSIGLLASDPSLADQAAGASDPLLVAQGETIVAGLPPRATLRSKYFTDLAAAENAFMVNPLDHLHAHMAKATKDFDEMVAKAGQIGPAAVERARASAVAQVDGTEEQLTQAIEHARDTSAAALVKQHDAGRIQLIAASDAEAKAERAAASARGGVGVGQAITLARGQSGAIQAMEAGLAAQRQRPQAEFADVAVRASIGMIERQRAEVARQRPRLDGAAADNRAVLDSDAAIGAARLRAAADANADGLDRLAADVGDALVPQAEDGCAGLRKLAGPVAASMKGYLPPFKSVGADKIKAMDKAIDDAKAAIDAAFNGNGGGSIADLKPPADAMAVTGPPPPPAPLLAKRDKSPNEFGALARASNSNVLKDELIAAFIKAAKETVTADTSRRSEKLSGMLHRLRSPVDEIQEELRGLTAKRGSALRFVYSRNGNLDAQLEDKLRKWFSSGETDQANVDQAKAALAGRTGDAAFAEMRAAKGWWNDDARVEKAARSMTPAQFGTMARSADGKKRLDEIQGQLNGVDLEVFKLLRDAEGHPEKVARANALRLQEGIDKARDVHGQEGYEKTHDAFKASSEAAGADRLSGDPTLDAGLRVTDKLGSELYGKKSGDVWQQTLGEFDKMAATARDGGPALLDQDGATYAGPGTGAYRYAIANRTYTTQVGTRESRRTVEHTDALNKAQKQSIEALLVYGVGSEQDQAGQLNALKASGGEPDPKKVEAIMHDPTLDARPGEVVSPGERSDREQRATDRYERIYKSYEKFSRPPGADERSVETVKAELTGWAFKAHSGNQEAQDYVVSLFRSPIPDTTAAFNYAIEGWGTNTDLLKQTFGRMTPSQVDDAVKDYNSKHVGGPTLYERLGIFGETSPFYKLSGDKRNEVEIAAMGVPVTDVDRFQVARMVLKQQTDQASWLGKHVFAKDEFDAMCDTAARLEKQSGLSHDAFENSADARGRFTTVNPATGERLPLGNFGPKGEFVPAIGGDTNAFDSAVVMAQLDANNYKDATDRVANFVTTAIVVVAAVVSTILTAGAAASIWIPVLVTAGAGLIGMGASWAIKGGRYGRDEILHDLAMTVIQAATAGLGAAAGVALKGGMPALRLAAGALKVEKAALAAARATQAVVNAGKIAAAEEAAILAGRMAKGTAEEAAKRTALIATGRAVEGTSEEAAKRSIVLSLGNSLSLGKEAAIGAGSSAFAGGATAALDADAWRDGKYASGILHGIGGGLLGGGAGAAAAHLGAGAVSGLAGAGRAALGIEKLAEGQQAHWLLRGATRVAGSATAGFGQSVTEGAYRAAAQGRDLKLGELVSEGSWAAVQNAAQSIGEHGAEEHHTLKDERATTRAAAARPVAEAEPSHLARLATEPGSPANDNAPGRPVRGGPVAEPGARSIAIPGTPKLPGNPTAPTVAPRRKPPPLPPEALRGGARQRIETIEFMEPGWGIMSGNATDRKEAAQIYRTLINEQPHLEVGVYKNTKTGEYVTFQGSAEEVHVGVGASGKTEGPQPEGNPQKWKELLSKDQGDWELQAHYHPVANPGENTTELWRRLPSAEDGDFHVMSGESHNRDAPAARESILHYYADGVLQHAAFGYDPHSTAARFWVEVPGPTPGSRVRHPFPDLAEYRKFFTAHTGETLAPPSPAAAQSSGTAPPIGRIVNDASGTVLPIPAELTFFHGTKPEGVALIENKGIVANRGPGSLDDFGPGFYVTMERENAQEYASARSGNPKDRTLGSVLEFHLPREAMGVMVDVRPGGEHRAAWEAFLDRPIMPGTPEQLASLRERDIPVLVRDLVHGIGVETRAHYFEKFLAEINLSHADAVLGDLGGIATGGIHVASGGTQIAIRSQALANTLSAQLPGRAAGMAKPKLPPPRLPKFANDNEIAAQPASRPEDAIAPPPRPPSPPVAEPPAPNPHPLEGLTAAEVEQAFATWNSLDLEPARPANAPPEVINPRGIDAFEQKQIGPRISGSTPLEAERARAVSVLEGSRPSPSGPSGDKRAAALRIGIIRGFETDRAAILSFRDAFPDLGAKFAGLFRDEGGKAVQGRSMAAAAMQLLDANPQRLEQAILAYQAVRAAEAGPLVASLNADTLRAALNHQGLRDAVADARNLFVDREHAARALLGAPAVAPADLAAYRARLGVATTETVAVARTNLPGLERLVLEGASPLVREEAHLPPARSGPVASPADNPLFTRHAEEDIANQVHWAITTNGLRPEEMLGYVVMVHVSQEVCSTCKSGTGNLSTPAGVLRQLSLLYPNLVFRITASGVTEPIVLYRGRRIE